MYAHLSPTEHIWLNWYGRLQVVRYIGKVGDFHRFVTGRPHPKARGSGS